MTTAFLETEAGRKMLAKAMASWRLGDYGLPVMPTTITAVQPASRFVLGVDVGRTPGLQAIALLEHEPYTQGGILLRRPHRPHAIPEAHSPLQGLAAPRAQTEGEETMNDKTATATLQELRERDKAPRQAHLFEAMMENFIRRWGPTDRYENADFSSQLASIVRQTFLDAQAPVQKQMCDITMRWPVQPLIIPRDPWKAPKDKT